MNDNTKTIQAALKNLIISKLSNLKICFRKSFHNKYADQWAKEEAKINILVQELKTGLNQGDNRRIQEALDEWKVYLMIDSNWKSERISDLRLKSFMNTSDGRFYGGAMNDFMMLLQKLDHNSPTPSVPSHLVNSDSSNGIIKDYNLVTNKKTENMSDLSRTDVIKLRATSNVPLCFNGINLSGVDLSGLDFEEASFKRCNLRGTNFSNAYLRRAIFNDADISGANFLNADITHTRFHDVIGKDKTNLNLANELPI